MDNNGLMQQQQQQQPVQAHRHQMERYIVDRTSLYHEDGMQNKHMVEYGIQSVHDAIKAIMPTAYDELKTRAEGAGVAKDILPLYSKKGTRLAMVSDAVIELDLAGSTFKQFRREYKGVTGVPQYTFEKKLQKFFWKALSYVKFCDSIGERKIRELEELENNDEAQANAAGEKFKMNMGLLKEHEYIRRKVHGNKMRYTMAGPDGLNHTGEYTTDQLREYMREIVSDYLFENYDDGNGGYIRPTRPIWIKIQGHSRGGVAAAEGAMRIRQMALEEYGEDLANMIRFDIIQYDPVPGADTFYKIAQEVDLRNGGVGANRQGVFESDKTKYAALGNFAQTTVVYSMHSEHDKLKFTPQVVKGVDRIVITPFRHSAGLDNIDKHEVRDEQGEKVDDGHAHRQAFIDAETQNAYRMASLNDLGRGVYILDEYNVLVRIHTENQFQEIMNKLYEDVKGISSWKWSQKSRHAAIFAAVHDWFENN